MMPVYSMVYVWDDQGHRVVEVHYGSVPGQPAPEGRFDGSFEPEKMEDLLKGLEAKYPSSRYTLSDWHATSLRTFFMSRYGWTAEEFRLFSEGKLNPMPAAQEEAGKTGPSSSIRGIEIELGVAGQKSGLPAAEETLRKALLDALEAGARGVLDDMRAAGLDPLNPEQLAAYKKERRLKGLRNYDAIGDVPICWGRLTADTPKKLVWYLREFMQSNREKIERVTVPASWAQSLADFQALLPEGRVSLNSDPDHQMFSLDLKEVETGARTQWTMGTRDALKVHFAPMVDTPESANVPESLDGKLTLVQSKRLLRRIEERLAKKDAPKNRTP